MANTGTTPWQLRDSEWMIAGNAELLTQQHLLIGITRVRDRGLRRRQHGPDGEAAPQSPENLKAVEGWKGGRVTLSRAVG